MDTRNVVSRAVGAKSLLAYRGVLSAVTAGACFVLAGCPTVAGIDPNVSPRKVVTIIAAEAEREKRVERNRAEEKKKLVAEAERDLERIIAAPTCYSGDVRDLDGLAEKIHRHEAGAPQVLSLSETTETWRREYGTGGGGGGC